MWTILLSSFFASLIQTSFGKVDIELMNLETPDGQNLVYDLYKPSIATKENQGIISETLKEEIINVFLPTTPNPTSGFLLMVPKKDLIYLDVTFEQASKFIVSAGTSNIN